jgi:hypothetical protein
LSITPGLFLIISAIETGVKPKSTATPPAQPGSGGDDDLVTTQLPLVLLQMK